MGWSPSEAPDENRPSQGGHPGGLVGNAAILETRVRAPDWASATPAQARALTVTENHVASTAHTISNVAVSLGGGPPSGGEPPGEAPDANLPTGEGGHPVSVCVVCC